jgi:hypothetical protein
LKSASYQWDVKEMSSFVQNVYIVCAVWTVFDTRVGSAGCCRTSSGRMGQVPKVYVLSIKRVCNAYGCNSRGKKEYPVTAIVAVAVRQYCVESVLEDWWCSIVTMWRSRPGPSVMPLSHPSLSQDLLLHCDSRLDALYLPSSIFGVDELLTL